MDFNSVDSKTRLITLTRQLIAELKVIPGQREITLNDSLQGHLGIDSISRGELASRIEKEFNIELPLQSVLEAETLADLLTAIAHASPATYIEHAQAPLSPITDSTIDLSRAVSLHDVLLMHAAATPDRPHMYLQDEKGREEVITYQQLLAKAKRVAYSLISRGLEPHDTVAIMLPTEPGFFYSFMGILLAGGVPVPIYPPARAHQLEEYAKKEINILNNAAVRFLITFPRAKGLSQLLQPFVPSLKDVLTVDELLSSGKDASITHGKLSDIALIQYTSGSTNQPKGVTLTHYNLLSNIRAYGEAAKITSQDVCVSWLPLYHDLGLIGNWLGSLYFGVRLIAFSPLIFLSHPERWLWAIHHHRGTISAGPNFSYELCVRKIKPEMIEGLNLSSWRLAINGAEMVHPKTLHGFTEKFAAYGFKPETFLTVYGLAENALGLTTPALGTLPVVDTVDRKKLEKEGLAVPTQAENPKDSLQFVCCGHPLPKHEIRIVDDKNHVLPERTVGHIQFCGPSSMQGYYNNIEATRYIFHGGWWDTGDLGYLVQGEVFITGRSKDIIIKSGRNLFATEIEDLVGSIAGVRQGCVIAFSLNDEEKGTEKLIIVAEHIAASADEHARIIQDINKKIVSELDIMPDDVVLVAPRIIPKTSSGKLQRNACKLMYQKNTLAKKRHLPVSIQYTKIAAKAFFAKIKNQIFSLTRILYTGYIGFIFALTFLPVWLTIHFVSEKITAVVVKKWFRLLTLLSFCPQKIIWPPNFDAARPVIFVANHCSYLDVVLLVGILPAGTRFVGKRSLFRVPVLRTFLTKLNYIPVDKENSSKGIDDMRRMEETLQQNHSLCIFPEGTFSHAAGLRPFKLSAFKMAAAMNIPVCPIAINGTRHILRGNSLLMKAHPIITTIGEPCYAEGKDWSDVINLKNKVYAEILQNCGENALDFILPEESGNKNKT